MTHSSSSESYKIAAYITAYEDPEAVDRCANAILKQSVTVSTVLVVDNSNDSRVSSTLQARETVSVLSHPENIGVGAGLKIAVDWALQNGYDFLWTFDQDSEPDVECLQQLIHAYEDLRQEYQSIGIVAPLPLDLRNEKPVPPALYDRYRFIGYLPSTSDRFECDAPITSGSLINLKAAEKIELPRVDLFIDGVDWDYGIRLRQQGFKNFLIPHASMYHQFGDPIKATFLGQEKEIQQYSPLRHYYICRNHTYLDIRHAEEKYLLNSILWRMNFLVDRLTTILLYDPAKKRLKSWACLLGTYHGFIGRLGKLWK